MQFWIAPGICCSLLLPWHRQQRMDPWSTTHLQRKSLCSCLRHELIPSSHRRARSVGSGDSGLTGAAGQQQAKWKLVSSGKLEVGGGAREVPSPGEQVPPARQSWLDWKQPPG